MKTPTKSESIAKLAQWCVENSSETFSAFFEWSAHISEAQVDIHIDGWDSGELPSNQFGFDLRIGSDGKFNALVNETIAELEDLLSESKQRNSPENAAKLQAERDAKELAAAKATIARLEGE